MDNVSDYYNLILPKNNGYKKALKSFKKMFKKVNKVGVNTIIAKTDNIGFSLNEKHYKNFMFDIKYNQKNILKKNVCLSLKEQANYLSFNKQLEIHDCNSIYGKYNFIPYKISKRLIYYFKKSDIIDLMILKDLEIIPFKNKLVIGIQTKKFILFIHNFINEEEIFEFLIENNFEQEVFKLIMDKEKINNIKYNKEPF